MTAAVAMGDRDAELESAPSDRRRRPRTSGTGRRTPPPTSTRVRPFGRASKTKARARSGMPAASGGIQGRRHHRRRLARRGRVRPRPRPPSRRAAYNPCACARSGPAARLRPQLAPGGGLLVGPGMEPEEVVRARLAGDPRRRRPQVVGVPEGGPSRLVGQRLGSARVQDARLRSSSGRSPKGWASRRRPRCTSPGRSCSPRASTKYTAAFASRADAATSRAVVSESCRNPRAKRRMDFRPLRAASASSVRRSVASSDWVRFLRYPSTAAAVARTRDGQPGSGRPWTDHAGSGPVQRWTTRPIIEASSRSRIAKAS